MGLWFTKFQIYLSNDPNSSMTCIINKSMGDQLSFFLVGTLGVEDYGLCRFPTKLHLLKRSFAKNMKENHRNKNGKIVCNINSKRKGPSPYLAHLMSIFDDGS